MVKDGAESLQRQNQTEAVLSVGDTRMDGWMDGWSKLSGEEIYRVFRESERLRYTIGKRIRL